METNKTNLLTPENEINIKGGKDIVRICYNIEVKQCMTVEGKYCGPGAAKDPVEIQGPVNPWG